MTLCIAAECSFEEQPATVLCFDWRAQVGDPSTGVLVGTDNAYKLRELGPASVLLAGQRTMADELLLSCRDAITELSESTAGSPAPEDDLPISELLEKLRQAAARRKTAIIRHFVEINTGVTFEEFKKVPQDHYRDVWLEIRGLSLGADLLIVCFGAYQEPIIIRLDRWGSDLPDFFGPIATGERRRADRLVVLRSS